MIYLDTHVVVWLYQKERSLFSDHALSLIEKHECRISPAVILEMEYLYEIFRITEHGDTIVSFLEQKIGLQPCDKPFNEVVLAALQMKWTRDPFDRLITAQASLDNDILVTKDSEIAGFYSHAAW